MEIESMAPPGESSHVASSLAPASNLDRQTPTSRTRRGEFDPDLPWRRFMGDVAKPASPASMEELWAHRAWVHRVARALVADPSRADDLEQETWIRAQASPPRHGSALKAWLGTVMRRLASDLRRSDRRRLRRERVAARPEGLPS